MTESKISFSLNLDKVMENRPEWARVTIIDPNAEDRKIPTVAEHALENISWNVEGIPLSHIGLDGAVLIKRDGSEEPITGFSVADTRDMSVPGILDQIMEKGEKIRQSTSYGGGYFVKGVSGVQYVPKMKEGVFVAGSLSGYKEYSHGEKGPSGRIGTPSKSERTVRVTDPVMPPKFWEGKLVPYIHPDIWKSKSTPHSASPYHDTAHTNRLEVEVVEEGHDAPYIRVRTGEAYKSIADLTATEGEQAIKDLRKAVDRVRALQGAKKRPKFGEH